MNNSNYKELEITSNNEREINTKKKTEHHFRIKWITFGMFLIITIYFLYILKKDINRNSIELMLNNFCWRFALFGFLFYLYSQYSRSRQFRIGFPENISNTELYIMNGWYNTLSQLIPYRLGELSLLYYGKKKNIPSSEALGLLIIIKIIDFIIMAFFYGIILVINLSYYPDPRVFILLFVILLVVSISMVISLIYFENFIKIYKKLKIKWNLSSEFWNKIEKIFDALGLTINKIKKKHNLIRYIFWGLNLRIGHLITTYFMVFTLQIPITPSIMILNELFLAYIKLVPLSLLASLGYYETTFAFLLNSQGFIVQDAFTLGFLWHLLDVSFLFGNLIITILIRIMQYLKSVIKEYLENKT